MAAGVSWWGEDLGSRWQQQLQFPISQPLTLATVTITLKLRLKNSEPSFSHFTLFQSYRDPGLVEETRVYMCVHAAVHGLGQRWGLPFSPPPASSLHLSLPLRSEVKWKLLSHVWLFVTPWTIKSWNSPGQNTGVGASPFSRGSSQPRGWAQISCIAGRFFTNWAIRETPLPPALRSLQQVCWPELYSQTNPNPNISNACSQCYISFIHSFIFSFIPAPSPDQCLPLRPRPAIQALFLY